MSLLFIMSVSVDMNLHIMPVIIYVVRNLRGPSPILNFRRDNVLLVLACLADLYSFLIMSMLFIMSVSEDMNLPIMPVIIYMVRNLRGSGPILNFWRDNVLLVFACLTCTAFSP